MIDEKTMERAYRERLDENIINCIAQEKGIGAEEALAAFYGSRLAAMMDEGLYGVQYLDYRNLVQVLIENEPERFDE